MHSPLPKGYRSFTKLRRPRAWDIKLICGINNINGALEVVFSPSEVPWFHIDIETATQILFRASEVQCRDAQQRINTLLQLLCLLASRL